MSEPIDEATESFLRSAAADLQRQIGRAGVVGDVALEPADEGVTILASIAVGTQTFEVRGNGDTLVAAYADLVRVSAAGLLATLFTELAGA